MILETRGHWFILIGIATWAIYLITQYLQVDLRVLLDKLLVDDAFYYFNIAKNVVAGRGFTFDGLNRTNGFQPLWQFLMLPIFRILKDPLFQIRAVILLGGLLHIFSGFLLFLIVNKIWSKGWALVITDLWVLNHNLLKINLSGMESPLFAVTFLAFVLVLIKSLSRIPKTRVVLLLGFMTALVSLSRVEASILFLFVSSLFVFELYKKQFSMSKILACLTIYLSGFLILFAPYLTLNLAYFKTLLPVSGQVKFFYEFGAGWIPSLQPDLFVIQSLSNIKTFAGQILRIAFGNFGEYLNTFVFDRLGILVGVIYLKWIFGIAFIAAIGLGILRKKEPIATPYGRPLATLGLFSLVHFLMISSLLPHFAAYNTWYFPAILIVVVFLGTFSLRVLFNTMGRCKWVFGIFIVGLIFAQIALYRNIKSETDELPKAVPTVKVRFYEATQWMNENLPSGSVIGSFSAGIVGFFSTHCVVNLDGFANSRDYLGCLREGKIREYIERIGVAYIADYFSNDPSKEGINWCGKLKGENIRILMKWPLPENVWYMVLQYDPQG